MSTNKRRFRDKTAKLDLDLTYICDRLIAMALPGVQGAVYRNDIKEVARFFAMRHYAAFCVVSLVEPFEESFNGAYDPGLIFGQVQRIPFHDHSAPSFKVLIEFCEKATNWLNLNRHNTLAVHCRGGKGRTGTFCSALMRWTGLYSNVRASAEYYARRRTMPLAGADVPATGGDGAEVACAGNMQGVDAPSQQTMLRYLDAYMETGINVFAPPWVLLSSVTIKSLPLFDTGVCVCVCVCVCVVCVCGCVSTSSDDEDAATLGYRALPPIAPGLQRLRACVRLRQGARLAGYGTGSSEDGRVWRRAR